MGGEEAGFAQLRRAVQAAGTHELQCFVDARAELVILLGQQRVGDEIEVPLVHLMQVGETALGEGTQQVQAGSGLVVGLQQALRIGYTALGVEVDAIDDVAAVRRQRNAVDGFITCRAWLGELTGHASDLHHRAAGSEGHDDCHLQQHFEGVANLGRREFGEALGAVAALQQERAPARDLGELPPELPRLAGEDQRRQPGERALDALEVLGIRIFGLLLNRLVSPAVGAPGVAHGHSRSKDEWREFT